MRVQQKPLFYSSPGLTAKKRLFPEPIVLVINFDATTDCKNDYCYGTTLVSAIEILKRTVMNEEQSTPEKAAEAGEDTSKVFLGDSSLQSEKEFEKDKGQDDYYAVDDPKKGIITSIGDGEMRNEGTVGMGDIAEENPFSPEGMADEQDKAEQNSGD
jgi:hypothetical protein